MTKPLTLKFHVDSPQDLSAGFWGFTDDITVTIDSGTPGGDDGEFAKQLQQFLVEWYDGASVIPAEEYEKYLEEQNKYFPEETDA